MTSNNLTLSIIKPDAIKNKNVGFIIDDIVKNDFNIIKIKKMTLNRDIASDFYIEHYKKSYYKSLIDYIISYDIIVLLLSKKNAVEEFRNLIGDKDPKKANKLSIRYKYGKSIQENSIHGSSSIVSAKREISFFFSKVELL
ncbi:MAG: nucleoside-diphosphate kinase [Bacteroides sp.]|nr:MAG: nucleoside-diphosphate kinase [Bacteroides sp.]